MDIQINPKKLEGAINAIPSKSDAHRLLLCAALAEGETRLRMPGRALSQDVAATVACLRALGCKIQEADAGLRVTPIGDATQLHNGTPRCVPPTGAMPPEGGYALLPCGESGSTLRFLLPAAAALGRTATFTGAGRLPRRPVDTMLFLLREKGCTVEGEALPFSISGKLKSGRYDLAGNVSSQYVSGLLFALPLLAGDSEVRLTSPLESAGYVTMTLRALARFGIAIEATNSGYIVPGGQCYRSPGAVDVEGDWSNAACWLAAGCSGRGLLCRGLAADSAQPDRVILDILNRMGAEVGATPEGFFVRAERLCAAEADVSECPDLVPVLAVLMALAEGYSRITNAARLRLKESDRLHAVSETLNALGAVVVERESALEITGVPKLRGGTVDGFWDHRIVMAAALASAFCERPVRISNAQVIEKSYPDFWEDFRKLGGEASVIHDRDGA